MRFHRSLALALAVCGGVLAPAAAHAQSPQPAGWALNRFEPAPAGDVFFLAEHPWYNTTRLFAAGIVLDYAQNPLVARQTLADGTVRESTIIEGMLNGHLVAGVSFLDRFGINLSFPISFMQSGNAAVSSTGGALAPAASVAPGDLRAGLRIRIFGQATEDPFSLHVGAMVWIPTGSRDNNTGDGGVRVEPRLTLAGTASVIRWSLGAGFMLRTAGDLDRVPNLAVGNELRLTAAVALSLLDHRLTIGPEAYVATSMANVPQGGQSAVFTAENSGAEVLGAVHYLIADSLLVGLGAGPGIQQGYGVPSWRGVATVQYAPVTRREAPVVPVDTDRDGVFDPEDMCPTVPMGDHPDPARRGCPLQDTDSDGVYDNEDQCVTVPMGEHPDPARPGCPLDDRDADGVLDPEDQCVTVPQGDHPDPERRGCPDEDDDHDTVLNHEDQCRTEPRGPFPDPSRPGCPLPDRDHDTVPDPTDACPDQPGVPSPDPRLNGCPTQEVVIDRGVIRLLQPVYFDTNRDSIKRRSFRVLSRVADVLRNSPHIRRVSLDGHTDARGDDQYNLDLSQRRMNSVMRFLIDRGVAADRLEAHGYGETRPVASNETSSGRARNRRVEFVIIDPAVGQTSGTPIAVPAPPVQPPAP